MTERQYHPVANLFPLLSGEEFDALTNDIAEHGLRDPICLHTNGSIIDGRNRYRACLAAGVKPDFYTFDGTDAELLPYVLSLNLHRRHLNPTQLGFVGAEVEEYYAIEARKRQAHGMTAPGATLRAHVPEASGDNSEKRRARNQAAEAIGTSARTIANAKKLKREAAPEIVSACIDGTLRARDAVEILDLTHDEQRQCLEAVQQGEARTVTKAKKQQRNQAKREAAQALRHTSPDTYNVLYCDPPWQYSNSGVAGAASNHYPTMPTDELCDFLGQSGIQVAENAVLFMWVTVTHVPDALEILRAWGFQYKTQMVWVKSNRVGTGAGTGFYVRGQHELLLIATRGSMLPLDRSVAVGSVHSEPTREHSRKPDAYYEMIESLYPGCSRIEIFARTEREGWASYGNETRKF